MSFCAQHVHKTIIQYLADIDYLWKILKLKYFLLDCMKMLNYVIFIGIEINDSNNKVNHEF